MKKTISFLIWTLCFLVLLIISDQFLLRYPGTSVPVLGEFQQFYRSFRSRLFHMPSPGVSVPVTSSSPTRSADSAPENRQEVAPQYIYVDQDGQLNFASSLEEIPPRFRDAAEPLQEK